MARIRTIKPDFFSNEGMSTVSPESQIMAAGLLCVADDEGYFNANPGLIKAAIFPLRELSMTIPQMFRELSGIGYVRFGSTNDGKRWGHIIKFCEHQRVSHPAASKIKDLGAIWEVSPLPPASSSKAPEDSMKPPQPLRPEGKGKEGNGKEAPHAQNDQDFKPSECTPIIRSALGISGQRNWVTATEAIEAHMAANPGSTAQGSAEEIARLWPVYRGSPQGKKYPMNPEKWLSSGEFLRSENWTRIEIAASPPGSTAVTSTDASELIRTRQEKIKAFKASNGKN